MLKVVNSDKGQLVLQLAATLRKNTAPSHSLLSSFFLSSAKGPFDKEISEGLKHFFGIFKGTVAQSKIILNIINALGACLHYKSLTITIKTNWYHLHKERQVPQLCEWCLIKNWSQLFNDLPRCCSFNLEKFQCKTAVKREWRENESRRALLTDHSIWSIDHDQRLRNDGACDDLGYRYHTFMMIMIMVCEDDGVDQHLQDDDQHGQHLRDDGNGGEKLVVSRSKIPWEPVSILYSPPPFIVMVMILVVVNTIISTTSTINTILLLIIITVITIDNIGILDVILIIIEY